MILKDGGSANRPGTFFVGEAKLFDGDSHVRLIPFVFNNDQTYVLEFGYHYIRVIHEDAYVLNSTVKTITAVTRGTETVITSATHGFVSGDSIYITGVEGATELNGRIFTIYDVTVNSFKLYNENHGNLNSSSFGAYLSGGTATKLYVIATTYADDEIFELKLVQSADVITIVHPNHQPANLSRTDHNAWTLANITFGPAVSPPSAPTADCNSVDNLGTAYVADPFLQYAITEFNQTTNEESLISTKLSLLNPNPVSNPAVFSGTTGGAGNLTLSSGTYWNAGTSKVILRDPSYLYIEVPGAAATGVNFSIQGTDKDGNKVSEVIAGPAAKATKITTFRYKNITNIYADGGLGSTTNIGATDATLFPLTLTFSTTSGHTYRIYKAPSGVFGFVGEVLATGSSMTFRDIGIDPDYTFTPPVDPGYFASSGNYPSVVSYFQQRKVFANTDNDTEKVFSSQTGRFTNFSIHRPIQDDDAVVFNLAGRQVNAVKDIVDLGTMVMFTQDGEYLIQGNQAGTLVPGDINPKQVSYNGSGDLAPLVVDEIAIYLQTRGSVVRSFGTEIQADGYRGNDLTTFAAHLFQNYTLVDWAYQKVPHSIIWAVRSDGKLVALTFNRNQQITAWHIHDFGDDTVESVATIPNGNEDSVYVVINREGYRFIEKLTTRQVDDIKDCIFMDAALTYDGRNTTATTMTLSGSGWTHDDTLTLTASGSYFASTDVGNEIQMFGLRLSITAYSSVTVVSVKPNKDVLAAYQGTATTDWTKAVDTISGLYHLEGKEVSVLADGFVVASPNNESYDVLTVSEGAITLDRPYGVIHVGLPYISDLETLDIDIAQGESLAGRKKNISKVEIQVEKSRGLWIGSEPPSDDLLEGLTELKIRNDESYDDPVALATDNVEVLIRPEWNSNGRIFIRQVDPLPLSVLAVVPCGLVPVGRG